MLCSFNPLRKGLCLAATVLTLSACSFVSGPPEFNPKTCLDEAPRKESGLHIIQGPRTEQSITADMQTAYCNGQVLLKLLNEQGKQVHGGTVWFKIIVEYTGEVYSAEVVQSDIQSSEFLHKVSDMILSSDFTPWQRHDQDAEFIYPMTFERWWD